MLCPSPDEFLAFLEGTLASQPRVRLEEHFDACAECRELVAALGKQSAARSRQRADSERTAPACAASGSSHQLLGIGSFVDHYRIQGLLGRGGMGEVYLAEDTQLARRCAVKVLRGDLLRARHAGDRVLREARATARFAHPNIVAIYGVGRIDSSPYLALEFVPGKTLRQRLREGPIPPPERVSIATAIATALSEAHRNNVSHGDLKPANVMIGDDGRVRVLDFGLARVLQVGEVDGHVGDARCVGPESTSAAVQGTPPYMAPEQWDDSAATLASDVWALGIILFELVAGRVPFSVAQVARKTADVSVAIDHAQIAPGAWLDDEAAWMRSCLQVEPTARPTARQLASRLGQVAERLRAGGLTNAVGSAAHSGTTRSLSPTKQTAPPPGQDRALRAIGAIVLAGVMLAIGAGYLWREPTAVASVHVSRSAYAAPPSAVAPINRLAATAESATPENAIVQFARTSAKFAPAFANVDPSARGGTSSASSAGPAPAVVDHTTAPQDFDMAPILAMEERAEMAERRAAAESDPAKAEVLRAAAVSIRSSADEGVRGIEVSASSPSMSAEEAARVRRYAQQARTYLDKRRAKVRP